MSVMSQPFIIDPLYEDIAAPKYFDFGKVESRDEVAKIESWFDTAPADPMSRKLQPPTPSQPLYCLGINSLIMFQLK